METQKSGRTIVDGRQDGFGEMTGGVTSD